MEKKYLAKIIATDNEGLQMISVCSAGAKVKISDIKYLSSNKVFLLSIQRNKNENDQENIDQSKKEMVLELLGIDYLKNKDDYEISLFFNNNAHIALSTEVIEVKLEDQNEIK